MPEEVLCQDKVGGYVSELQFNNGNRLELKADDIVLFVGPNNVGKSQALRDIYSLCEGKNCGIVVKQAVINKYNGSVRDVLEKISVGRVERGFMAYDFFGKQYSFMDNHDIFYQREKTFGRFCSLFVANLDTMARLSICQPPANIERDEAKKHPIHFAAFDSEYRKELSDYFEKAFGEALIPNALFGSVIPLCIGKQVCFDKKFNDEQERVEEYATVLKKYKKVHEQGDGVKSFTGILLYLMLEHVCTFLIDEPESFLHAPQAKIMGQIIGRKVVDKQAFISTHSEEIIKGLLDVCPQRIKIVRITRDGDVNNFSILDNEQFNKVWNDPLLKYSNIMSSLFHKSVVLCESDSDCKMYSIIESHLKQKSGKYSETLFIHCSGKHRMAKIATALKALDVKVTLLPDIDVLNDENVFKGITEAFGIDWNSIQRDYKVIVSNLHSSKENIKRDDARAQIDRILKGSAAKNLSKSEISEIKEVVNVVSKWDNLKKCGIPAIPGGEATAAFKELNAILKQHRIFIIPVGELECFVKEVSGHGPEWVNKVLEEYPDLDNSVYEQITKFVSELNL